MSNQWLRLWHDMPNDPKWRVIAKASGQPVHLVMALYVTLLVDASKNTMSRGVTTCHDEDLSVTLECDMSQIEQIKQAMQGRVLDGDRLKGWESRQPKREDFGNAETGAKSAAERQRERPSSEVWRKIRTRIFSRDDYTCQYCGVRGVKLECDHVYPVALGGGHDDSNLVTACFKCNRSKRSKTLEQWRVA